MPGSLSSESILVRSTRLSWRVLDGEVLILHPEAGTLHRLNDTGTRMWELIDGKRSIETIARQLTAEYHVDDEVAVEQLIAVAGDLLAGDLASESELVTADDGAGGV